MLPVASMLHALSSIGGAGFFMLIVLIGSSIYKFRSRGRWVL